MGEAEVLETKVRAQGNAKQTFAPFETLVYIATFLALANHQLAWDADFESWVVILF